MSESKIRFLQTQATYCNNVEKWKFIRLWLTLNACGKHQPSFNVNHLSKRIRCLGWYGHNKLVHVSKNKFNQHRWNGGRVAEPQEFDKKSFFSVKSVGYRAIANCTWHAMTVSGDTEVKARIGRYKVTVNYCIEKLAYWQINFCINVIKVRIFCNIKQKL